MKRIILSVTLIGILITAGVFTMTSSTLYTLKHPFTTSEGYGEAAWSTAPIRVSPKSIYRLTLSATSKNGGLLTLRYYDKHGFYLGDAPDTINVSLNSPPAEGCPTGGVVTTTLFQPPASAATVTIVIGSEDNQSELTVHALRFERITRREAKDIIAERTAPYPRPAIAPDQRAAVQKNLRGTMNFLSKDIPLSIVILGDSIANDTYNGLFRLALAEHYPNAKFSIHLSVRGGSSCQFYRQFNRTAQYVLRYNPDLVIIAGVSHQRDTDAIRDVIRQIQESSKAEILFMTGPHDLFNTSTSGRRLSVAEQDEREVRFKEEVRLLADLPGVASFDFTPVWKEYIASMSVPETHIMRDNIHYNFDGKLLLATFLADLLR